MNIKLEDIVSDPFIIETIKVNMKDIPQNTKSPILSYCRQLIKDGRKPNTRLEIYRNHEDPDVIVENIGEAAKYTVEETGQVGPRFVKYNERYKEIGKNVQNPPAPQQVT